MHEEIYEKLREVAREGKTVAYSELAPLAGLSMKSPADRNRIAQILDDINRHEHDQGRPMLTAVVIR